MAPKAKDKVVLSLKRPVVEPIVQRVRSIDELPFDVLDRVFSYLKSHPKALFACSEAHPFLSQIVEKYRFHHIIISTGLGVSKFPCTFNPYDLRKELAKTPRIVQYVAILQFEFNYAQHQADSECLLASFWEKVAPKILAYYLEEIASLLPMFPVLECIMLPTLSYTLKFLWQETQSFRSALENCLHLPTLQEVHIGDMSFPLSMLDNHTNINHLALSGPPKIEPEYLETTCPQIKSLTLEGFECDRSQAFRTWAKRHIVGLQSLKSDLSCSEIILDVLKICSNTLENLYLCLQRPGLPEHSSTIDLSSLTHLRHLTIQGEIFSHFDKKKMGTFVTTTLLKAVKILKTASSLQQLTIEIYVDGIDVQKIDLTPLRFLTESSACFHHIDLYTYTGLPSRPVTGAIMSSLLAKHGLMPLIEQGVLDIHPEETAPTLSRSYIARENDDTLPEDFVWAFEQLMDIF